MLIRCSNHRYTMEGDLTPYHGTFSPSAGIIPRTLYALFDKLAEDRAEFSVRCSFIELYNEELRDLNAAELAEPHATGGGQPMDKLSNSAPSSGTTKDSGLKIYDDKNGGTGVLIQGLQETWITSAEEGLKVLKRGSERRQIAATKCNEQSRYAPFTLIRGPLIIRMLTRSIIVGLTPSSLSLFISKKARSQEEKKC